MKAFTKSWSVWGCFAVFVNSSQGDANTVPYQYSNALFTTQDTYGMCLNMGTLCRVSHIGCPCQYQSMEILINSLHPNNAIQPTLYINQFIQYIGKCTLIVQQRNFKTYKDVNDCMAEWKNKVQSFQ